LAFEFSYLESRSPKVKEERSGKVAPVLATEDHTQRPGEEECKLEAQTTMSLLVILDIFRPSSEMSLSVFQSSENTT